MWYNGNDGQVAKRQMRPAVNWVQWFAGSSPALPTLESEMMLEALTPAEARQMVDQMLPGTGWRLGYPGQRQERIHIRAVVDDHHIVFRVWSRNKQRWGYCVEPRLHFELFAQDGALEQVRERSNR